MNSRKLSGNPVKDQEEHGKSILHLLLLFHCIISIELCMFDV